MENLTILCKDFDLNSAIKSYAEEKMSSLYKFLNKDEDETSFNLRIGKTSNHHNQGKIFYAEVTIHTPEKNFGGKVEAEDIYSALDILKDDMATNISHYRDRLHTLDLKSARQFKESMQTI